MSYFKLFKILQSYRRTNGKVSAKSFEIYPKCRKFATDSTSQRAVRLAYDRYSPPADREKDLSPVILLHSMFDSRNTWKFIAPEIANRTGRKVYAVDARNHGESPWSEEMTFDLLTEDLDAFLSQHNIHKATLVGHSMGGRASLTLALKKPEKIEKLVVEDMHTRNFRPTQDGPIMDTLRAIRSSVLHIPADSDECDMKKVFLHIMKPLLLGDPAKLAKLNNNCDITMMPFGKVKGSFFYQANLDAVENFVTTSNICQNVDGVYNGDALFIYGTKSFFRVDTDTRILDHFPRAIKLAIEGSSHFVHVEDPKNFVEEVTNFINGYNIKLKN